MCWDRVRVSTRPSRCRHQLRLHRWLGKSAVTCGLPSRVTLVLAWPCSRHVCSAAAAASRAIAQILLRYSCAPPLQTPLVALLLLMLVDPKCAAAMVLPLLPTFRFLLGLMPFAAATVQSPLDHHPLSSPPLHLAMLQGPQIFARPCHLFLFALWMHLPCLRLLCLLILFFAEATNLQP